MAAHVIGLDVGTNAVRAAEVQLGDPPYVHRFGQVGLPPGAVVDGEVVDVAVVSAAIRRLWAESGFSTRNVRVGLSSPRLIVRTITMPALAHDELISAVRLQLDDYVPLPPAETVFDLRPLDGSETSGPTRPFVLAATHQDALVPLVDAVLGADLDIDAVDVIPSALALALTAPGSENDGVDIIVSIGAGTVVVVAARDGEASFSRILTSVCGHRITERIASRLGIDDETAERQKRSLPIDGPESETALAAAPLVAELIEEVQASIAFYAELPEALPVRQVLLTGGGALLSGLLETFRQELPVEVSYADPFAHVRLGDIGFEPSDLPYLAPYMAGALGLALAGGRPKDRRLNLTPLTSSSRSRPVRRMLVGAGTILVLSAAGTLYVRDRTELTVERNDLDAAEAQLASVQERLASQRPEAQSPSGDSQANPAAVAALAVIRATDWSTVERSVATGSAPFGITISSFQGTLDQPVEAGPPTVDSPLARLILTAWAPDLTAIADWLDWLSADPRFSDPWVSGLTVIDRTDGASSMQFTLETVLTNLNLVDPSALEVSRA